MAKKKVKQSPVRDLVLVVGALAAIVAFVLSFLSKATITQSLLSFSNTNVYNNPIWGSTSGKILGIETEFAALSPVILSIVGYCVILAGGVLGGLVAVSKKKGLKVVLFAISAFVLAGAIVTFFSASSFASVNELGSGENVKAAMDIIGLLSSILGVVSAVSIGLGAASSK